MSNHGEEQANNLANWLEAARNDSNEDAKLLSRRGKKIVLMVSNISRTRSTLIRALQYRFRDDSADSHPDLVIRRVDGSEDRKTEIIHVLKELQERGCAPDAQLSDKQTPEDRVKCFHQSVPPEFHVKFEDKEILSAKNICDSELGESDGLNVVFENFFLKLYYFHHVHRIKASTFVITGHSTWLQKLFQREIQGQRNDLENRLKDDKFKLCNSCMIRFKLLIPRRTDKYEPKLTRIMGNSTDAIFMQQPQNIPPPLSGVVMPLSDE